MYIHVTCSINDLLDSTSQLLMEYVTCIYRYNVLDKTDVPNDSGLVCVNSNTRNGNCI